MTHSKCLPIYLAIDTSASMAPHMEAVNGMLDQLYDTMLTSPRVSEFAWLSIISFNTESHLVMPLMDAQIVDALPVFTSGGLSNYGGAFRFIRHRIDTDIPALREEGKLVLRPAVIFISSGEPTDSTWLESREILHDLSWRKRPHIFTIGFGESGISVLTRVASRQAFIADSTAHGGLLTSAIGSLANTSISSGARSSLVLPREVEGFRSIPLEFID